MNAYARVCQPIRYLYQTFFTKKSILLKGRLARNASGSFGLKIASAGLSFIVGLLLARLLGSTGYGTYAYAMNWVGLLAVPGTLGLDRLLVREVAAYETNAEWRLLRGLLRWANQAVLIVSSGLALLAAFIGWILVSHKDSLVQIPFLIALTSLPLVTLIRLRQSVLRGLNRVIAGQVPEMLIQPVIFIFFIGAAYMLLGKRLTAPWTLGMNLAATAVAFGVGTRVLLKTLPLPVQETFPSYKIREWIRSALPLMFIAGMKIINAKTDIIMLGAIKGPQEAGIYSVANRGAELISFILIAINTALAPTVVNLFAAGEIKKLQKIITKSTRIILIFSLPIGLILIVFGHWFLLLFGESFTQGRTTLSILSAGQLVNATMGSVGLLLVMTGHERSVAIGVGISAALNVILNALLIPQWGTAGAAIATASSMIAWNILLAIWVYKKLGVHSTVMGEFVPWRKR
ncbi:MAG: flippase [Candidatus Brocadia sp. WS118]|nr:MAG: flippase [Candidatus Brocadia sp. WS118]